MKHLNSALLLLLLITAVAHAQPANAPSKDLAASIDALISQPEATRGFWGIQVISLADGKTLYARNADKLFTPASNTKLFTTAAALALIGPDYRFHTTVETATPLDKYGRISGDVCLIGRGDPNLSGRTLPYVLKSEHKLATTAALEDLADQMVKGGVKQIDGDIVADDSYYVFDRYAEGWAQDDMLWEYGAPVSALTINDNILFLNIQPGEKNGDKAYITVDPENNYYQLDNRIITAPAGLGARKIAIHREPGSRRIELWGSIPLGDTGDMEELAIEDPAEFTAQLFRDVLRRRGIVVQGGARVRHTELPSIATKDAPAAALPAKNAGQAVLPPASPIAILASHQSLPLFEDLRLINKVSQNLHAELALRLLGRLRRQAGNIESGLDVLNNFLQQAGLNPDEYVFHDGSGLSRENLVTPAAIVKLLRYMAAQSWSAKFQDTLPVAGVDGLLADRFKGTPAEGRVRAKTGSLDHVSALSGYAMDKTGNNLVFSILVNNYGVKYSQTKQIIDGIVEAIVESSQ